MQGKVVIYCSNFTKGITGVQDVGSMGNMGKE